MANSDEVIGCIKVAVEEGVAEFVLIGPASQAYAEADSPWRHLRERESRYRT